MLYCFKSTQTVPTHAACHQHLLASGAGSSSLCNTDEQMQALVRLAGARDQQRGVRPASYSDGLESLRQVLASVPPVDTFGPAGTVVFRECLRGLVSVNSVRPPANRSSD
jgi:hypothetical protein